MMIPKIITFLPCTRFITLNTTELLFVRHCASNRNPTIFPIKFVTLVSLHVFFLFFDLQTNNYLLISQRNIEKVSGLKKFVSCLKSLVAYKINFFWLYGFVSFIIKFFFVPF